MAKRAEAYINFGNAAAVTARWLQDVRRDYAPRPQLVLEPARCVLLAIDMQRYFCDPAGRCYLPAAGVALERACTLIDAWRGAGAGVVYTRHCHHSRHDLGMLGRFYSDHIACGEPDAQFHPRLKPSAAEAVIEKQTYDAFLNTALEAQLQERGASQVLITGVLTHLCCETTARAAFCRGFEVYFAADATATSTEVLHCGTLRAVADGVGIVISSEEAAARCAIPH